MQPTNHPGTDRVYGIVGPAPIILSDFTTARREPTRPPQLREPGFERAFDGTTLFYDAFRTPGSDHVIVIAPPFLNLLGIVKSMRVTAAPSGRLCDFRVERLDRCTRVRIDAPHDSERLTVATDLGSFELQIGENLSALFRGMRTIFTKSKDNAIPWILDWIRFHRDVHGAEAVLIYDNASAAYDTRVLHTALREINGLKRMCIVEWPFKFGPRGGQGSRRFWDSDYCQHGILEHARWRFLAEARSVMTGDIDELVVSTDKRTAFELAERSIAGVVRYFGRWIIGIREVSPLPPRNDVLRHRDFDIMLLPGEPLSKLPWSQPEHGCAPKWTVVPSRFPSWVQWKVHTIGRWPPARMATNRLGLRHFREIGTNWKYDRTQRDTFDPERHKQDTELRAAFARVQWDY
jgi:hypothetical protein